MLTLQEYDFDYDDDDDAAMEDEAGDVENQYYKAKCMSSCGEGQLHFG
jgi:hypothetical protein